MRHFRLPFCLILIIMLTACSKSQFMDLSGFVASYNEVADSDIDLTDFIFIQQESREFKLINGNVLLTLKEAPDGKIMECRVMMTKLNEKGEQSENISADSKKFLSILKNTLQTFCSFDRYAADAIIGEFSLGELSSFLKEGELTKQQGNFYFVYYSTPLVCQVTVYNTYLSEIEPTEKPVSKATELFPK
ncbi:MAG: hypothetical protein IJW86_00685 [Clostridia bacterium]|nr:hypothetical protein [Clostridia bacterium]